MTDKDYERLGRLLEDVVVSGTGNIKKVLWFNFVKGIAYGFGIFLAGTLVVGIVISILNMFDTVPVVGPFIQNVIDFLDR